MSHYDYTFKILLLGDASVGKEEFAKRFCYNIFNPSEGLTIGVDFHVKTIELNNTKIKLQIWDVGGEERFRFLLPTYCLGANAAFFMYDITRASSLTHLPEWVRIITEKAGNIPIMLVGTKLHLDQHRVISREEGISIAEWYNLSSFVEISSRTGENVENAFKIMIELTLGDHGRSNYIDSLRGGENPLTEILRRIPNTSPSEMYQEPPEFKINEKLILRLENNRTNIYVSGRLFSQCKYLLLNISSNKIKEYENIDSIDEAAENLDRSLETRSSSFIISPYTEFWGHCSNLQAWYEHDYDTRLLHRNLAFPLLRALARANDTLAKKVFKEELALRLETGYPSVVIFLVSEGYLDELTEEELDTILENPKFIKSIPNWFTKFKDIPEWFEEKIRKKLMEMTCLYCGCQITEHIILEFLKGKPMRCEYCYTNFIKEE
ncbi:MAG: Rab family GTPase [Promethearchaeota archaeon]